MELIDRYYAARDVFNVADEAIAQLFEYFEDLGCAFGSEPETIVVDGYPDIQVPVGCEPRLLTVANFPTLERIGSVLSAWHAAKADLVSAWYALPERLRAEMTTPERDDPRLGLSSGKDTRSGSG